MRHRVQPATGLARAAGRRGLTLAELLVVITIITIGATLILPVVVNFTRTQRVGSAARSVQAMLHGARSLAVARREQHGLRFFRETELGPESAMIRFACLITIDAAGTPAPRQQTETFPPGLEVRLETAGMPLPIDPPPTIFFQPDGTVDPGLTTPLRISLINRDDEADSVDVIVRRTGVIEVLD